MLTELNQGWMELIRKGKIHRGNRLIKRMIPKVTDVLRKK